ncbi:MAG: hypothetical protein OEZ13_12570 [Spirochaetia bacterium]|nr:hypothetical protein [Spirochaetia bacterium]
MNKKPRIQLKPISTENPYTLKIYESVKRSIEDLHIYIDDFLETKSILKENLEKFSKEKANEEKSKEVESHLSEIETKIEEVTDMMQKIADEMPLFVKFEN